MLQQLTNLLRPRHFLLPLVLVSVVATGLTFLPNAIGVIGRWLCLGLLAIHVVVGGRAFSALNVRVAVALAGYVVWCLFTALWSDVPSLSWPKAGALALTTFAALWGGHEWARAHRLSLGFLWPTAMLALIAGAMSAETEFVVGGVPLHAGATVNPNFLGTVIAMSLPVIVWMLFRNGPSRTARAGWTFVLTAYLAILYLAASRGAYVIFLGTVGGVMLALRARRAVTTAVAVIWIAAAVTVVAPDLAGDWVQRNLYKHLDSEFGVLHRREAVWAESYDAAVAGGVTGAGYGVSIGGDPSQLESVFTAQVYAREKGSSQLAIIEETGLIGFGLYLLLMAVLFQRILAGFWRSPHGELRTARGIVAGTLAGLAVQSILEAWWVGPGSLEFVFFWAMAGTGLALTRVARFQGAVTSRPAHLRRARAMRSS